MSCFTPELERQTQGEKQEGKPLSSTFIQKKLSDTKRYYLNYSIKHEINRLDMQVIFFLPTSLRGRLINYRQIKKLHFLCTSDLICELNICYPATLANELKLKENLKRKPCKKFYCISNSQLVGRQLYHPNMHISIYIHLS